MLFSLCISVCLIGSKGMSNIICRKPFSHIYIVVMLIIFLSGQISMSSSELNFSQDFHLFHVIVLTVMLLSFMKVVYVSERISVEE